MKSGSAATSANSINELLAHAVRQFQARFGRAPKFAAAAPGRVNLIGEHTDYNEGFVLPMAIERHAVVVAGLAPRKQSTFWAIDLDETVEIDLTLPLRPLPGKSANYLLGVAAQLIDRGFFVPNLDVAVTSTVPIGAGLSSSAALEVAFITLLERLLRLELDPMDKVMLCRKAERQFPGTPCGIMDMYVAVRAAAGHALLIDCRSNDSQRVLMPPPQEAAVLVADTHIKHSLASGQYARLRATCESAAAGLSVPALRDATIDMLHRHPQLTERERRCALHVIAESTRTVLAAAALGAGNLQEFGELMFASHDSLRDLLLVSCPELDRLVETAKSLRKAGAGVFGARMTGGGFGGCVVALCRTDTVDRVSSRFNSDFESAFKRRCTIFTTAAADGARVLTID